MPLGDVKGIEISREIDVETCYRIAEGRSPDALDLMRQGKIQLIINTPRSTGGAVLDGNMMRRLAVELTSPSLPQWPERGWKLRPLRRPYWEFQSLGCSK